MKNLFRIKCEILLNSLLPLEKDLQRHCGENTTLRFKIITFD